MKEYIIAIILGITATGITLFIQKCMFPGMILSWYRKLLVKLYFKSKPLAKVLGICTYCNGFWIVVILNLICSVGWFPWPYLIVSIAIWYLTLNLILKDTNVFIIDEIQKNYKANVSCYSCKHRKDFQPSIGCRFFVELPKDKKCHYYKFDNIKL